MPKEKYLFIYHNGARGDFLASVLIGDVLESNSDNPWVILTGADNQKHHKMHRIDTHIITSLGEFPIDSFSNYKTIRIKFETESDYEDAHILLKKKTGRNVEVKEGIQFEQTFSSMDHLFDTVVCFRDLFDLEKLKLLFKKYRLREMTKEEEQRVLKNINLNLQLLKQGD